MRVRDQLEVVVLTFRLRQQPFSKSREYQKRGYKYTVWREKTHLQITKSTPEAEEMTCKSGSKYGKNTFSEQQGVKLIKDKRKTKGE